MTVNEKSRQNKIKNAKNIHEAKSSGLPDPNHHEGTAVENNPRRSRSSMTLSENALPNFIKTSSTNYE